MILLDPNQLDRAYPDERSAEIMRKTVGFFEAKGKEKLLADYYERPWYADFLEFVKKERIFASTGTPGGSASSPRSWASTGSSTGTPGRSRCSASAPSG
jgi:acyl-CoA dehydrogenase